MPQLHGSRIQQQFRKGYAIAAFMTKSPKINHIVFFPWQFSSKWKGFIFWVLYTTDNYIVFMFFTHFFPSLINFNFGLGSSNSSNIFFENKRLIKKITLPLYDVVCLYCFWVVFDYFLIYFPIFAIGFVDLILTCMDEDKIW